MLLQNSKRKFELDWLRILTILSVFFFHIGMVFVDGGFFPIRNKETSPFIGHLFTYLHLWRLPLLLLISGAGSYLAFSRKSASQFFKERSKRLLIPLLFGSFFIIVPIQVYIERMDQYSNFWEFYKTIFNFIPYPHGNFSTHHLWFISYLFLYSILAIPFLKWSHLNKSISILLKLESILASKVGWLITIIPLAISQVILLPYFPHETHNFMDIAYLIYYFYFFLLGILLISRDKIWMQLKEHKKFNLTVMLVLLTGFYLFYFNWDFLIIHLTKSIHFVIWRIFKVILCWYTILSVIGYAQSHLSKSHKLLKPLNESIYPFYILHQTVIVVVGYFIIKFQMKMEYKFISLTVLSLIVISFIYLVLIKYIKPMRLLMGMKKLK